MLSLYGCNTGNQSAVEPPPSELSWNAATIIFLRPTGPPAAVKGKLSLDDFELGEVFVRRYAEIKVEPGRHNLKFSFPSWAAVQAQTIDLQCDENVTYYVLYASELGFGAILPPPDVVVFSITSKMQLVPEKYGRDIMSQYELAFQYGRIKAEQAAGGDAVR